MTSYNLPPPGSPFQLILLKDNQGFVAHDGELSLVKATESSNYFFVLEEETTAKGNKGHKVKLSTSAEHSIASHSVPQTGGSRLFALSPLSILAQVVNDDVDNWGNLAGIDYKGPLDYEDALALEKVLKGEWEVEKADYDTDAGHINEPAPVLLATQTVTNNSDISQSSEIDMTRGVAEISSFSFTSGFSLSVGA